MSVTPYVSGVLSMVVCASAAAAAPGPADLVLLHGKIYTEDARRSVVQALAVRGNAIVAVGTDETIGTFIGPSTRKIDVQAPPALGHQESGCGMSEETSARARSVV